MSGDNTLETAENRHRLRLTVRGAVQGVGFRPFVYRLACDMGLGGWVCNSPEGVLLEVEGPPEVVAAFPRRLKAEHPPAAHLSYLTTAHKAAEGETAFRILPSVAGARGGASAVVLADRAPCDACLAEISDPAARRFRYPFTTCTHCGPRFTIMTALPYDRPSTTLSGFPLCEACRKEYDDPLDRRFHAQPLACPACGPHLALWDGQGREIAAREKALAHAVAALRAGRCIAVKGVGGFHLMCDARNEEAVATLRARKYRPVKPFAVMVPSVAEAAQMCEVSPDEAALLTSPAAPIVLLQAQVHNDLSPLVAPHNPTLGIMLPSSPLHHLLMQDFGGPLIATSGNRANEPVCTNEAEALQRLKGIADLFLVHNRPIAHRADDSLVRMMADRPMMLRRARGYAPMPLDTVGDAPSPDDPTETRLAHGAYLKNTVALATHGMMIVGPHVGDLETVEARQAHAECIHMLTRFYGGVQGQDVVVDLHPDVASAVPPFLPAVRSDASPPLAVQHHYAHALSCLVDNGLDSGTPALAVVWDGLGYGADGTLWGGEFLQITPTGYERVAHLLPFPLIGGDLAARYPARAALGLLYVQGNTARKVPGLPEKDKALMLQAVARQINCPLTTSAGRLFDGMAGLLGLCAENTFEGQAAQALEYAAEAYVRAHGHVAPYPLPPDASGDWRLLVDAVLQEGDSGRAAARFQTSLAALIAQIARSSGEKRILLTGGCFQNKALLEETVERLRLWGLEALWHRQIPPNDGGLSIGQVAAGQVAARIKTGMEGLSHVSGSSRSNHQHRG